MPVTTPSEPSVPWITADLDYVVQKLQRNELEVRDSQPPHEDPLFITYKASVHRKSTTNIIDDLLTMTSKEVQQQHMTVQRYWNQYSDALWVGDRRACHEGKEGQAPRDKMKACCSALWHAPLIHRAVTERQCQINTDLFNKVSTYIV